MTTATGVLSRLASQPALAGLYTGGVLAVFVLIASLSFGSLIFAGELSAGLDAGIGVALISAAIVGLVVAWRSSYPATMAIPQDRTAPILALIGAQVAVALPHGTPLDVKLINVQEIDLNRELRAAGVANLAGGLAGGMLGFQSMSVSRLAHDLSCRTRLAAIVAALLCGLALAEGQYLIRQGAFADELYFIESGEVSTLLETGNGAPPRRLRRQGGGTVLGEVGMLLRVPRSASVLVNRTATVHCLTETSLQELKRARPDVAANFYEFLSRYLCERVLNTTKSLRTLAD